MADSFRKRVHGAVTGSRNTPLIHPIRRRALTAKLLLALLPLGAAACRETPPDTTPPDIIRQIVMKKWAIEPSRIEVPQGDRVELIINSTDVEHGIAVPRLGIREPVQPGRPTIVRFRAQNAGTYAMTCSVLCGRGHDQMTGQIVITPRPTPSR
jgi:cytochrome c oxidase subunit II